jgi:3-oxoacyl-[acyl-carrier-protein] synthase II
MRRVVITGIGMITPIGEGKEEFWKNLLSGTNGIDTIKKFDVSKQRCKVAAELKDFDPKKYMDKKAARKMDRFSQYAVAAAKLAFSDSGLDEFDFDPFRAGVIIGTGVGGIETVENNDKVLIDKGPLKITPFLVPMLIPNMASGNVAIELGLKGVNLSISTACATGTHSVGEAYHKIKYGLNDIILSGGTEAPITPLTLAGFASAKALSFRNDDPHHASRPFDKDRDGFVMGEGSGVLVLEEYEHAKKRGAHIYAEIVGYGATDDAHHMTAPHPEGEGAINCIKMALNEAGISPEQVGYVNAHGTSTPLNDKLETKALKAVFKEHVYNLLISSNKSMFGHLLGAAGAVEAIATALSLQNGIFPPTINLENPDPECDLNYIPNESVEAKVEYAISNSFGFGGHNGVLLLKKV